MRAPVGIVERKLQRTYVHDSELEGNEDLAVGRVAVVIDDEGARHSAVVSARLGRWWELALSTGNR